jgi:hypothetical protein
MLQNRRGAMAKHGTSSNRCVFPLCVTFYSIFCMLLLMLINFWQKVWQKRQLRETPQNVWIQTAWYRNCVEYIKHNPDAWHSAGCPRTATTTVGHTVRGLSSFHKKEPFQFMIGQRTVGRWVTAWYWNCVVYINHSPNAWHSAGCHRSASTTVRHTVGGLSSFHKMKVISISERTKNSIERILMTN